jgi:Bivalent Mical/EHBP Rab binding domain
MFCANVVDRLTTIYLQYCFFSITETERKSVLPDDEQRILQELVEVVQQRDALVALLEEERLK